MKTNERGIAIVLSLFLMSAMSVLAASMMFLSQVLGEEFTRSLKPFEVEIVVAEVGVDDLVGHERNALYRVGFDGTIQDQEGYCAIGGSVDSLQAHLAAPHMNAYRAEVKELVTGVEIRVLQPA